MTAETKTPATIDTSDLDPQSLAAIRDLLATEPQAKPQPVKERIAEKAASQDAPDHLETRRAVPVTDVKATTRRKQAKPLPELKRAAPGRAMKTDGLLSRLKAQITGYRPRPKHIALAALVLFVVFRPWLALGIVLLMAFVTTGIFLILGYDGFWHRVMRVARWYARRHPSRSTEMHRKLDTFAMKFDGFLDRFPEGSVDGLYLPDFGDLAEADARHGEALDRRFDSLRESEA